MALSFPRITLSSSWMEFMHPLFFLSSERRENAFTLGAWRLVWGGCFVSVCIANDSRLETNKQKTILVVLKRFSRGKKKKEAKAKSNYHNIWQKCKLERSWNLHLMFDLAFSQKSISLKGKLIETSYNHNNDWLDLFSIACKLIFHMRIFYTKHTASKLFSALTRRNMCKLNSTELLAFKLIETCIQYSLSRGIIASLVHTLINGSRSEINLFVENEWKSIALRMQTGWFFHSSDEFFRCLVSAKLLSAQTDSQMVGKYGEMFVYTH